MNVLKYVALSSIMFMVGCAHNINISPNTNSFSSEQTKKYQDHSIAYVISPAQEKLKVTTAGGGGDKVSYTPYADLKTPIYSALAGTFGKVYSVSSVDGADGAKTKGADFILVPNISTDSSSSSAFTWPPTNFTTNLACDIYDNNNVLIKQITVTGVGVAEFDEFKADFSLSARRSTEDALNKLVKEIESAELSAGAAK